MTASRDPGRTRPDTPYRMVFRVAALPLPTRTVYVRSIHSSVTAATCGTTTIMPSPTRCLLASPICWKHGCSQGAVTAGLAHARTFCDRACDRECRMTSCFGSSPLVSPFAYPPSSTSLPPQDTRGELLSAPARMYVQSQHLHAGHDQAQNGIDS